MKKCSKCEIDKELTEFYKTKVNVGGLSGQCKSCKKEMVKLYRENNLEQVKEKVNEYRIKNRDKALEYNREWREENKEYKKKIDKTYRDNNKEELNGKRRKRYQKNKERELAVNKKWREENSERKKETDKKYAETYKTRRNERHGERMNTEPLYNLSHTIRGMISKSLRTSGYTKNSRTQEILGCSFEDFKLHLESMFENWMDWSNKGLYNGDLDFGWDIDHIIPISSAITEEEIIQLNHYSNLRPLCSYNNRYIKKDNLES